VLEVVQALIDKQTGSGWTPSTGHWTLAATRVSFARQIVDYLRGLLLIKMDNAKQVETTQECAADGAHARFQRYHRCDVIRAFKHCV